ncbi:PLP-dependent aminotransferase family protein [Azospirillum halopraeferens]|uniref:aminotransferase-like domain-containing protein n=1 Tax=Azospirillum halopraeferens TaxID=34010 RepID=UPI000419F51D|nr:PLP-dependent aminotransferase family protein [Azospirillum halopraeferens]
MTQPTHPWLSLIRGSDKPRYVAIADAIADDLRRGRLAPGDRLPPQRTLAEALDVDFTTVARGYNEAQRRGLVESRVGAGTFVRPPETPAAAVPGPAAPAPVRTGTPRRAADRSMNLPPEIEDPALIARMRQGWAEVGEDLVDLLRYQEFGGSPEERQAGADWLARRGLPAPVERLLVCPGTHAALLAVLGSLTKAGDVICAEALTYPGLRALAAQSGLELIGLPMDGDGILPDAFAEVCRTRAPKVLYCNPTLQNPTTISLPAERRAALIEVARRHGVTIVEDDAYGALPVDGPPPLAALAPDIVFYIGGLAKSLGAGLRVAYLVVPEARRIWQLSAHLRATTVMASPLTVALATRWITDGTADAILAAVRAESAARQVLARGILPTPKPRSAPEAFHFWLRLPDDWSRSTFAATMRTSTIGIVVSDAFTVSGPPPEAVRIGLGGCCAAEVRMALEMMAHTLSRPPALASAFL